RGVGTRTPDLHGFAPGMLTIAPSRPFLPVISTTLSGPPSSSMSWSRVFGGSFSPRRSRRSSSSCFMAAAFFSESTVGTERWAAGCGAVPFPRGFSCFFFFLVLSFLLLPLDLFLRLAHGSSLSESSPKGLKSSSASDSTAELPSDSSAAELDTDGSKSLSGSLFISASLSSPDDASL
ncbi:unnamed protein product, partial [Ixodes hexagonus]